MGFADISRLPQRSAFIPAGGIKVEAGCYTYGVGDSSDIYIPTQLTQLYSLIVNDGTVRAVGQADITSGKIWAEPSNNAAELTASIINYIAMGY